MSKEKEPKYAFQLTEAQCREFEDATHEVEYVLLNAAAVFEYLHAAECGGDFDNSNRGKTAILDLVAKGLNLAASEEGVKMTQLSGILRSEKELVDATDK